MLNHPTQDLMQSLGYEATSRQQKRFDRRLKAARLRQAASVEDVDYRASRGLDRGLFQKLATNDGSAIVATF